jgi:hypothetical protein
VLHGCIQDHCTVRAFSLTENTCAPFVLSRAQGKGMMDTYIVRAYRPQAHLQANELLVRWSLC